MSQLKKALIVFSLLLVGVVVGLAIAWGLLFGLFSALAGHA